MNIDYLLVATKTYLYLTRYCCSLYTLKYFIVILILILYHNIYIHVHYFPVTYRLNVLYFIRELRNNISFILTYSH